MNMLLPCHPRVRVPPIKSQGIKTKLVPLIARSIRWDGAGVWIEPFLGSGSVLFNVAPARAYVSDTNKHIVSLYQAIQARHIKAQDVRQFLSAEGRRLLIEGEDHYYRIRDRFNDSEDPLDFLFLNRSCFNGIIRFNRKGHFNVPFCRKPDRFRSSYITKIVNQVAWISDVMKGKDWVFKVSDWKETLNTVAAGDFVYVDPPYTARHTDYYNSWNDSDADELVASLRSLRCGFAYSMWLQNKYRRNEHLLQHFAEYPRVTASHFYHVGPTESLRNSIEEALVVKHGFLVETQDHEAPEPVPPLLVNA